MQNTTQTTTQTTSNLDYLNTLTHSMTETPWLDDQPAKLVHLSNTNGMTASFMDIGATWLSCVLPIKNQQNHLGREVLLRSPNMVEHIKQAAYFGAIIGRYANRIANGQFSLNNKMYVLAANNGKHSLHGGTKGFASKRWVITAQSTDRVTFTLDSPHGEGGYPGNLHVNVTYELSNENALSITYFGRSDTTTVINLTNHAYFNLAGIDSNHTAFDHTLQLCADYYLPVSQDLIPTGEIKSVTQTEFDLRTKAYIEHEYDHAFIFRSVITDGKQHAVTLIAPDQHVHMLVKTTKPSIQIYTGNFLLGIPGPHGEYSKNFGLALETQYFPDGPNNPQWGTNSGILRPHLHYQHQTTYQFIYASLNT